MAHHAQGDDQIGADGQRDHTGKYGHSDQRHAKALRVDNASVEFGIDKVDQDTHDQGGDQTKTEFGKVNLVKNGRFKNGLLDDIFCAHIAFLQSGTAPVVPLPSNQSH